MIFWIVLSAPNIYINKIQIKVNKKSIVYLHVMDKLL
jgi:hypothetical protein